MLHHIKVIFKDTFYTHVPQHLAVLPRLTVLLLPIPSLQTIMCKRVFTRELGSAIVISTAFIVALKWIAEGFTFAKDLKAHLGGLAGGGVLVSSAAEGADEFLPRRQGLGALLAQHAFDVLPGLAGVALDHVAAVVGRHSAGALHHPPLADVRVRQHLLQNTDL